MISNEIPKQWKTIIVVKGDRTINYELNKEERLKNKFKRAKKRSMSEKLILSNLNNPPQNDLPNQTTTKTNLNFKLESQIIFSRPSINMQNNAKSSEIQNSSDKPQLFGFYDDAQFDNLLIQEWKHKEEEDRKEMEYYYS